jgi:mannose-6-phosphate isomerase-like protein (cupin superfamily)
MGTRSKRRGDIAGALLFLVRRCRCKLFWLEIRVTMKVMNRRKLLASSAAALAASTFSRAEAQSGPAKIAGPFTVRAGEGRSGGQWQVHGEKAFSTKVSGADVGKTYAAIEVHTPPDRGPELHIHLHQNELFFLLKGSIGMQCGSERMILKAGDAFMAPANVPHAYVTLGAEPAHMLNVFDPAGEIEAFFAEYAPLVSVNGEPDHKKIAEVNAKHGIKVVGPPLKASSFAS